MTNKKHDLKRRDFLKTAAVGAAAAAAPWVWIPKKSFAATPAFGKAKHVIIFYAGGGMRTSCVFNGDNSLQYNPYGINSNSGTEWGVSNLFGDTSVPLSLWEPGDVLPSFVNMSKDVAVLGTVDHLPGYAGNGDGSHNTCGLRISTGRPDGVNGILSYIGEWAYQTQEKYVPTFIVGNQARLFGLGVGQYAQFRPVALGGADDFSTLTGTLETDGTGLSWNSEIEQWLDSKFMMQRPYHARQRVKSFLQAKKDALDFIDTFMDPALQVTSNPTAEYGGISNEQLLELFPDNHWGQRTALAVRLLQIGSPAVAIGQGGYDSHSNEQMSLTPKIESLGRSWSGLQFVLQRMPHPEGGTYWDHTLVLCCTEFARDNTFPDTGWNNGGGADHRGTPASRLISMPLMGGMVSAGGQLLGRTDPKTYLPVDESYHSQSVLATLADALGMQSGQYFEQPPISGLFE